MRYAICQGQQIVRIYSGRFPDAQLSEGQTFLPVEPGVKDTTHLVVEGEFVAKPEMPAVLTGTTLSGLPEGTVVTVRGNGANHRTTVDDGELEMAFDASGDYQVRAVHPLYLTGEYVVTA